MRSLSAVAELFVPTVRASTFALNRVVRTIILCV